MNTTPNTTDAVVQTARKFMARRIREALGDDRWVALRDLTMTADEVLACNAAGIALADVGAAMFDLFVTVKV